MEQICRHCREIKECVELGIYYLCLDHKGLKQYEVKEKKSYVLKRTPIKRSTKPMKINSTPIGKVSKREARNIANKKKVYKLMDEQLPHICTGCGNPNSLSHSHLVPVGQNKALEAVLSNITFHCLIGLNGKEGCHDIFEHDIEGRKKMLDYEENMHRIQILDPSYYALIKGKE